MALVLRIVQDRPSVTHQVQLVTRYLIALQILVVLVCSNSRASIKGCSRSANRRGSKAQREGWKAQTSNA